MIIAGIVGCAASVALLAWAELVAVYYRKNPNYGP